MTRPSGPIIWAENYNGVLDGLMSKWSADGRLAENHHEADIFVLWQDVRGVCRDLAEIAKRRLGKPVVVVQHGRGATRDYCPPNSFPLLADRICVWGEADRSRLLAAGIQEARIAVTGCPLFKHLKPRAKRDIGRNVLFAPIIAEKEEPENLVVYAHLKKWECDRLLESLGDKFARLKSGWATENHMLKDVVLPDGKVEQREWKTEIEPIISRAIIYERGLLNVKLTSVHDQQHYMSPSLITSQGGPDHVAQLGDLLANVDAMVALEEGTMQLLACALDIPVIIADTFKYGTYGGRPDYDRVEKIRTPACYWVKHADRIPAALDHALAHPEELRRHRIAVCESEGGAHLGDQEANIARVVDEVANGALVSV